MAGHTPGAEHTGARKGLEPPDISEKGGLTGGVPQRSDERLFMQLLAFGDCPDAKPLAAALAGPPVTGVVYEDLNDPRGVAHGPQSRLAIVQTMRKTQQTALYLDRLGPFFVGRAFWQAPLS
jgi:hypothetical protein